MQYHQCFIETTDGSSRYDTNTCYSFIKYYDCGGDCVDVFGYGDFDGDGNSDGGCFVDDDGYDNCRRDFLVFLFSPVYVVLLQ